uniref:Uncharacterized protein n=1 Tax=Ananas comosus var. bracteatus TaxID=296719 RepID=A0A6V7PS21_ANACO|nr:unnamed protein product [Ananas comosus var. bracteatus]
MASAANGLAPITRAFLASADDVARLMAELGRLSDDLRKDFHPRSAFASLTHTAVRLGAARPPLHRPPRRLRHLRRRLVVEFARAGLFEKKGRGALLVLAAMLLMLADAVYGVVASSSPAVDLLSAALMGALWMQSGFLRPQNPAPNSVLPDPRRRARAAGDGDNYAGDEEEDEDLGKLLELFPREQLISFLLSAATRDPRTLHRTPLSASA